MSPAGDSAPAIRRTPARLALPRLVVCAALCSAAFPAARCANLQAGFAVSVLQSDGAIVQLRLRMPATVEPVMEWRVGADPAAPRLVLAWNADMHLARPLPALPGGETGPLKALAFHAEAGQGQLQLDLDRPVRPTLHRVGDSWVLRLEPALSETPLTTGAAAMPAAVVASPTAARPRPASATAARGLRLTVPEVLLLDVTINGERLANVVRTEQAPGDALLLPADAWAEARLVPPPITRLQSDGTPAYPLDAVPGVSYRINRQNLSMDISAAPAAFLNATLRQAEAASALPPRPQPGVILNYDLSASYDGADRSSTGSAIVEAITFNRFGNFVSSALIRRNGAGRALQRLDTFWRYDMPDRLESVVLGDTIGSGGGWSRPARYGGIRWGRAFAMRPGFVTLPQMTLSGQAALPSTVDVLVNNARRISQPVSPGPFELTHVPVITGAGEVSLVVRDLLGRETVVRQNYYASSELLARGLSDFSLEGGWLRDGYGQESHYGDAFAAGGWRQGLSDRLTGEFRLELQSQRRAAGVELASLLGNWGVGRIALATSASRIGAQAEGGQMLQLGLQRSSPHGAGAVQYERAGRGFAPFAETAAAGVRAQRSRERWLASVGAPLWGSFSGGASYVNQLRWDGERIQLAGLSASLPLGQRASMNLSINKRLDGDGAWRADLGISMPLDNGVYTAARINHTGEGEASGAVSAVRNAPAGPGLGWRVEAATEPGQRARAGFQLNTSQAEWVLDVASNNRGQLSGRAGGRGTFGLVGGLPFASRPVGQGSFAVVEVDGLAGVPVMRSHQVVGVTDARGLAFVPGLLPWQKNQLEIDPVDLPLDTEAGELVQEVTPYAGSGSLVRFSVRRTRQALLVLHQASGAPVPLGARVKLMPGGRTFTAGRRGQVWLTDLAPQRQRIDASWPDGGCQLELPAPNGDAAPGKIGPLVCAGSKP